jgi:glucose/mannose-6-phosphate isomerase
MEAVKEILREEVVGISEVWAKGESKLEQILYLIWFGDFVSYWLALMNSTDPYRIDRINSLKERLKIHTSGG